MKSQIVSFAAACAALSIAAALPDVSVLPEKHQKAILANYQLIIIAQALNEGWEPDWNNDDEYKWFPYFDLETYGEAPAGSGFSLLSVHYGYADSNVPSRLCFRSRELAEYAAETFLELYKDYYLIPR